MFEEALSTGDLEHHISMFKDDGTTLARTSSDDFSDFTFAETFDDVTITCVATFVSAIIQPSFYCLTILLVFLS